MLRVRAARGAAALATLSAAGSPRPEAAPTRSVCFVAWRILLLPGTSGHRKVLRPPSSCSSALGKWTRAFALRCRARQKCPSGLSLASWRLHWGDVLSTPWSQSSVSSTDAADHRTAGSVVSVTGKPGAQASSAGLHSGVLLLRNRTVPSHFSRLCLHAAPPPSCPSATRLSSGQCPRLRAEGLRMLGVPMPSGRVLSFPVIDVLSERGRQSRLLRVARRAGAAEADAGAVMTFVLCF